MKKFDEWNKKKKTVDNLDEYLPFYHERQIRWCCLGVNIGDEQDGAGNGFSRPVLILKGFSRNTCLIVPLTTSVKKDKYRISIGIVGKRPASVIISQIRLIDTKRLNKRIATLDKKKFENILKAVKDML